jgi:hypothetical protein
MPLGDAPFGGERASAWRLDLPDAPFRGMLENASGEVARRGCECMEVCMGLPKGSVTDACVRFVPRRDADAGLSMPAIDALWQEDST